MVTADFVSNQYLGCKLKISLNLACNAIEFIGSQKLLFIQKVSYSIWIPHTPGNWYSNTMFLIDVCWIFLSSWIELGTRRAQAIKMFDPWTEKNSTWWTMILYFWWRSLPTRTSVCPLICLTARLFQLVYEDKDDIHCAISMTLCRTGYFAHGFHCWSFILEET